MMTLDHLVVSGETRDAAAETVGTLLGVKLAPGDAHPHFGTHNHLLGLADGLYLEAISVDPDADAPDRPRWFALDSYSGAPSLTNWICAATDLEALVRDLPEAGDIVELARDDLRWRMAVPPDGELPYDGCFPALIQWDCADPPGRTLPDSGCRLEMLTVTHPDIDRLQQRLSPYLDDARVHFEHGSPNLTAKFGCPGGLKTLR